jgi:hypothetical protein
MADGVELTPAECFADWSSACMADADGACVDECFSTHAPKHIQATDILGTLGLLIFSGLFSGLTLGLMSLDIRQLELAIAGGDAEKKKQAEKILPLRRRGNLLLCTLLLGNTLVNSGIAILTASFTGGIVGGIVSTVFILIFGEILPQSVCSRYGLAAGAVVVDLVRVIIFFLLPIALPMSKVRERARPTCTAHPHPVTLSPSPSRARPHPHACRPHPHACRPHPFHPSQVLDRVLGEELGTIYSRTELREARRTTTRPPATASSAHCSGRRRTMAPPTMHLGVHGV